MNIRKWMRCAVAVALSALVAVFSSACSQPANIESGAVTQEYPVTVNEVTLNAKPKKVAVLSGSLADVVLAIGYETSLTLASEDCTQPELQVLQKVSASDAQAIISGGADLVLAEEMDDATQSALTEAGVTVLLLEPAKNREDFERLYSQVGTALNGGSTGYNAGVKAAQKIFSSLDDLARLAPESNTVVTACYISDLSGQAVTGDELGSVMMSYMGLTNIFKGLSGGTFAYEDLKLSDPTMIFCTEEVRGQLLSDAQYANLTAVQTGRVYAVNPNYMRWQGRTVYTASIEMMGLAYPELTESSEASVTVELGTPSPEPSESPEDEGSASPSPAPEYTALNPGDENDDVFAMQARLSELGYLTVEYGGVYGEITKEAVAAFQLANGLEADGEASAETLQKLFAKDAVPAV
ncbi:MAG: peptidoglycan-binding protein [Hominenteromicrobium sp.]